MNATSTRTGCTTSPVATRSSSPRCSTRPRSACRRPFATRCSPAPPDCPPPHAPLWTSPPWFPTRWTSPWCATSPALRTRRSTSASRPASSVVTAAGSGSAMSWPGWRSRSRSRPRGGPPSTAACSPTSAPRQIPRGLPTMPRRPVTPRSVLRYAPVAAERAAALGAHREALAQLDRTLRFVGETQPRREAELLERYAGECRLTSRIDDGIVASARALSIWDRLGEVDRRCAQEARHAVLLWISGRSTEARRVAENAVSTLERRPPGPALAAALSNLASLKMLARDIPGAIETGLRAVALADAYDQQTFLATALNAVGSAQWFDTPDEAPATLARSLAVARAAGDDGAIASALVNLGSGAGEVRRYAEADRWLRETVAFCTERDIDTIRAYGLAWLARIEFEQGRWPEATEPHPRGRRGVDDACAGADRRSDGARSTAHPPRRPGPRGAARGGLATRARDRRPPAALAGRRRTGRSGVVRRAGVGDPRAGRGTPSGWPSGSVNRGRSASSGSGWQRPARSPRRRPAPRRPYALDPADGARAWTDLGCPYEAAMSLARVGCDRRPGGRPRGVRPARRVARCRGADPHPAGPRRPQADPAATPDDARQPRAGSPTGRSRCSGCSRRTYATSTWLPGCTSRRRRWTITSPRSSPSWASPRAGTPYACPLHCWPRKMGMRRRQDR